MTMRIMCQGATVRMRSANPRYDGMRGEVIRFRFYADSKRAQQKAYVRGTDNTGRPYLRWRATADLEVAK